MPSEPLDMIIGAISKAKQRIGAAVPLDTPPQSLSNESARVIATHAQSVFAAWETTRAAVEQGVANYNMALGDMRYADAERQRRADEAIAALRPTIDSEMKRAQSTADQLKALLERTARPTRPTPNDAAQEAAIAGIKADLRMLLDAEPSTNLIAAMAEQTRRYVAANDELAVWVLGGSDWPEIYLRSRLGDLAEVSLLTWAERVADALSAERSDEQKQARLVLQALEGPYGLNGALFAANSWIKMRLEQLKGAAA